ncbi:MAG: winged helix-turn-helix domain-containing protein [Candidatus Bathyarchaeia archaeon]
MTETDTYDLIFAALKNPIRREILLFLEQKGEASFTDIQNVVGITDTGLVSYHLKELDLLVEQSSRGKYSLSEIGQTSMVLFRKVEKEQGHTAKVVRNEIERYVGKVFFILPIIAIAWMIPASVDILAAVDVILYDSSVLQLISLQIVGFAGMVFGLVLFVVYDRHYYSKNVKTNLMHATVFAVGLSLLVLLTFSSTYNFTLMPLSVTESSEIGTQWLIMTILRAVCFVAVAPLVSYVFDKTAKRR